MPLSTWTNEVIFYVNCVLRLIDADAKAKENAVAVLLLNFGRVLGLVDNAVWAYIVHFLSLRAPT